MICNYTFLISKHQIHKYNFIICYIQSLKRNTNFFNNLQLHIFLEIYRCCKKIIKRTTKIRCFFFQISYQWVFPVQFVLWEQVTGNAILLPSDRTTIGESLYVQCIKHISNTNSLLCHSVEDWWVWNRNI